MNSSTYYILIPAYNAGKFLTQLVQDLKSHVPLDSILIIDDGSQDDTQEVLKKLGTQYIIHDVNQGKAGALMTGFNWGIENDKTWAITMDADGQHSPDDLDQFVQKIQEFQSNLKNQPGPLGALLGARDFSTTMPKSRVFSNRTTTGFLNRLSDRELWDSQCGYRAYHLNALKASQCLDLETDGFQWESEVLVRLAWAGFEFDRVPVQTIYQEQGSHISHVGDTLKFIKMWRRLKKEKKLQNDDLP